MFKDSINKTKNDYKDLFHKNSDSYLSLNWGSEESQILRFEILYQFADLKNKTILDVGSGLGDFYRWLQQNNKKNINYIGIDIVPEFVELAKKKYGDEKFICGDFLSKKLFTPNQYDYVFSSGIFATYNDDSTKVYQKFIERMFEISKYGIAFNSLSSWTKKKDKNECYADPLKVMEICRKFSRKLVIRHDYHPRDFTIFLYK
tara:strand:- start:37927 stop:38535 length:609 start_codon:yes stop_codon:yes gene_type:complete